MMRSAPPSGVAPRSSSAVLFLRRNRGVLIIVAVFTALFLVSTIFSGGSFGYFEASFMASGGATLALAAMGQALVILVGGFDLSVGSVVSLVNVVLATHIFFNVSGKFITRYAYGVIANDASQCNNGNIGSSASNIYNQVTHGFFHINADTDCSCHWFMN